ncbi:head GIN domain-containing protein [Flavihumibacter sp.]|uniref:head GIN domain-containing protein n=1 Tax=Flavihumibacter sp. TaxID=1913981 RepID=UPI002FCB9142|nr:DUF2807 domain-containing protein [Flavihumibacter sediminis]
MKKIILMAFMVMAAAGAWAQTTTVKDSNARTRNVSGFKGVKVSAGIELLLQQGDKDAVAVSSSNPDYTDRITTVVENGVLKIGIDNKGLDWKWRRNVKFKAYVSLRELESLSASSGSMVKTGSAITVDKLELDASSGAIINAEFKAKSISSDNSSGAITELKGTVDQLSVEASSGAIFKGYDISSLNCSADASSGALIHVNVSKELSAEASSGGLVNYKGTGTIRKVSTSSGGSVKSKS